MRRLLALPLFLACTREPAPTESNSAPEPPSAPPAASAEAPPPPTVADKLLSATSFKQAVELAGPDLRDASENEDPASLDLAHWAAKGLKEWQEVTKAAELTTVPEFLKDPDGQRGRVLVESGRIGEIRVVRGPWGELARGVLTVDTGSMREAIYFYAAGPTAKLVAGSKAVFAGVATGTFSYANVKGGQTKSVFAVGAFAFTKDGKPVENIRRRNSG
jgi:hypothetical protein